MAIKLVLSSNAIGNKVFPGVIRGYDAYEVDKYLDLIIKDYELIENNYLLEKKEIDDLNAKIKQLESEKKELELELGRIKLKYQNVKPTDSVTADNIDLVKRINSLEKFLYKEGYNPAAIK